MLLQDDMLLPLGCLFIKLTNCWTGLPVSSDDYFDVLPFKPSDSREIFMMNYQI